MQSIRIEKLVYGGEGLARDKGEVVFTPFVLPGELVEIEREGARQHVERARLVKVLEASPDRAQPACPYFGKCGGCQYQHATYDAQLHAKRDILVETLRRVGKINFDRDSIAIERAEPYGYRNRVQFHIENGRVGYRAMGSKKLVAIDQCPISSAKINEVIQALNRMVKDRRWPRFVESLEAFTDEKQVQWNVLEAEKPVAKHFFEWLAAEVPGTVGGPLEYLAGKDEFRVSGKSFFQVNRFLLERLAALAIGDNKGTLAWDLYAGVGLFTVPLGRVFERVVAVESGKGAAADLERNARRARVKVDVQQLQTEQFLRDANSGPDFVLADPPRAGLGKTATARLLQLKPASISIVSCDPATLARDLAALGASYEIERLTVIDLFPQTFHLETIAHLRAR